MRYSKKNLTTFNDENELFFCGIIQQFLSIIAVCAHYMLWSQMFLLLLMMLLFTEIYDNKKVLHISILTILLIWKRKRVNNLVHFFSQLLIIIIKNVLNQIKFAVRIVIYILNRSLLIMNLELSCLLIYRSIIIKKPLICCSKYKYSTI